jgi:hypothetical protein
MDVSVRSVQADVASAFYALLGGGFVGGTLEFLASRSDSLARAGLAAGVTAGVALSRCLWISLRFGSEGVTVTNYFQTRRLSWAEIEAIGWDRYTLTSQSVPSIAFRRLDGETVVAQAGWGLGRRRREQVVEALREVASKREIACYLAPGDIGAWTRRHENEPLSEHPALPKVDRRIALVRRHPWLSWVFFVAVLAAFVLFPLTVRAIFRS